MNSLVLLLASSDLVGLKMWWSCRTLSSFYFSQNIWRYSQQFSKILIWWALLYTSQVWLLVLGFHAKFEWAWNQFLRINISFLYKTVASSTRFHNETYCFDTVSSLERFLVIQKSYVMIVIDLECRWNTALSQNCCVRSKQDTASAPNVLCLCISSLDRNDANIEAWDPL